MTKTIESFHQHDSMQCGIASLQMVCKYFGREYTLDSLSKLCFATTEGVSMQCCPKRFSIKTKKGSKAKVERTTLAKSTTSFTSYGKYNTFRTSNR